MIIKTERLNLLTLSQDDLHDMYLLHSNEEVAKFNTIGIPMDIDITRKVIAPLLEETDDNNKTDFSWTIRDQHTNTFMGELGFSLAPPRYRLATLHYSILPRYWGKGYATEAALGLIKYCFEELNLHRIEAGCAVDNLASIRVLEKLGMQREGRKRKVLPLQSGWSDNYEFAILKEDFESQPPSPL
ncbi:GNAT family N-acetyltransferase [Muriicola sp. Z0-33]|uniref:GNAT family N-acetyltransferase n=1 Tax=Muriicola sp. Z0-33 TaxID=2816957 RepID=UPI00223730C8|nr:GNAT family N-acetyltransferase [Muriicola sp. Z0-33]MCW5517785.1 GNAT family N-acetyltransferase [Muriicola sp. Z0-33]